ncbi:hypothetical protein BJ878DRAFT_223075 [Calycina marina]|uniref:DUF1770-domain-containing protein n=1 Tax=Calycina marina TaxID=1763456 RepID=A0A9P7Z872_9HELO|nr:hypothetical protein BJ878DRAFT_223075 [Calycina marina]
MSNSTPLQIAETIQTASINLAPSPTHDINPSTAASSKQPVTVFPHTSSSSLDKYAYDDEDDIDRQDDDNEDDDDEIPCSVIRPLPRKTTLPPLPDMRFEQSYLASIKDADTVGKIMFISIRDQILLPLLQGTALTLGLLGWRHWNRSAQLSGTSLGARIRRWWYRTNNWEIKANLRKLRGDKKLAREIGDVSWQDPSLGFTD